MLSAAIVLAIGFSSPALRRGGAARRGAVAMGASAADVAAIQAATLSAVEGAFALTKRDFPDSLLVDAWACDAASGSVAGWAGEPKLGWVSASTVNHASAGAAVGEVTAWVAPSYDMPHLYVVVGLTQSGKLALQLDYVSRYDLPADSGYLGQFYLSTMAWQDALRAQPGAAQPTARQDVYLRTICSPMFLSLEFPDDEASLATVKAACAEHVARWVGWWSSAKEVNRMKCGSLFSRDTKQHRLRFQSHSDALKAAGVPAELAERVAQGMVGPGDEQYVGLGSS